MTLPLAVMVSVDYADLLAITLPRNRHHFERVVVVTTPNSSDAATRKIARTNQADLFCTNAFYDDGAQFNKWKALEQGLDVAGRHGLICLMDADVIWPREIPTMLYEVGYLYTPLCYVWPNPTGNVPRESEWCRYKLRRNQREWAGYTQIFWGNDPHLPEPPWHDTEWKHAGGADSFFQARWPDSNRIRPEWRVLHLGPHGQNWCGRVTSYVDGGKHPKSAQRLDTLMDFLRVRRSRKGPGRFDHERLDR